MPGRLAAVAVAAAFLAAGVTPAGAQERTERTPVIFVHGQSGSAQQFQSNAKRFSSAGYDRDELYAYEYDTSSRDNAAVVEGLDRFIDRVLRRTGRSKVHLIAHSRGTTVSVEYLSEPSRAAKVRRYVNIDGRSTDGLPGGVPTLGVWGDLRSDGVIQQGVNVYFPGKGHTEVATSAEAFRAAYRFFNGKPPRVSHVVPERPDRVRLSGRAVLFPQNTGVGGARLRVHEVDPRTGRRLAGAPWRVLRIRSDGGFGPFRANGRRSYEFELVRPGEPSYHVYFEPFERSDHFVRVPVAPGLLPLVDTGPAHSLIAVLRNREWWGDQPDPAHNDRLAIGGVNVINAATAPRERRVIAVFALDRGEDRRSDVSRAMAPFDALTFFTGADLFLQATPNAANTIAVTQRPRMTGGASSTVAVRSWPSSDHSISVQFKDYVPRTYRRSRR